MTTAITTPLQSTTLTGGFQSYLNYVYSQPVLTADEEHELFVRFQQENDLEAARKIILSHLRFVAFIARRYSGYGLPIEDLVQEGSIGLMKSVKRFDLSHGVRLASFALFWIKAEIQEYVLRNWKLVKIATTKAQRKLFYNLRKMKKQLSWMNNEDALEIASYLNVSVDDVHEMEARLYQCDSYFDESFGEAKNRDSDHHPAASKLIEDRSTSPDRIIDQDFEERSLSEIRKYLGTLDDRARDIIESRWMIDSEARVSLRTLAHRYGISIERVRQVESATLLKLREHLQACGICYADVIAQ